jgi:uncharacterized protein (DUF488 family)
VYYRRKILLALLQQFGGELQSTPLQKLLLVFTRRQQKPAYEFVPYKYGAYSFQARADKRTMIKYELLKDRKQWVIKTQEDYIKQLKETDRQILKDLYKQFNNYNYPQLIKYTYREYPFFAIRSEIAEKYMNEDDLKRIDLFRPVNKEQKLYTIGYEGIKVESYMNKLLNKDVQLLIDVRKNSISMKYGFSKSQLKRMCNSLEIEFLHLSRLGIESKKRKNLNTKADYEELFKEYEQEILPKQADQLEKLYKLYQQHKRIAITCFEREHTSCHRHKISDYLNVKYEVSIEHL